MRIDRDRTIWLTEISRRTFEEQALFDLESDDGLFVVVEDESAGTFDVLAKVASQGAGLALIRMLVQSHRPKPFVITA